MTLQRLAVRSKLQFSVKKQTTQSKQYPWEGIKTPLTLTRTRRGSTRPQTQSNDKEVEIQITLTCSLHPAHKH
jgi:hypothetical protein